jgi:D-sedoheptulose 7-phosphate isomerase
MKPSLTVISNEALRESVKRSLLEGAELRTQLVEKCCDLVIQAAETVYESLQRGGKIILCGNGGSAADAQHLAAEFVGRFTTDRAPLAAIALSTDSSALTAIGNDYGFEHVFSRQVLALGNPPDVIIGISTSGRSKNVLNAMKVATERGLKTIAFSGGDGGSLASMVDIAIVVPSTSTARIQECHITLEHIMCEVVECLLFSGRSTGREDGSVRTAASTSRWLRCVQES